MKKISSVIILVYLILSVSISVSAQSDETDYEYLTAKFIDSEIYASLKLLSLDVSIKDSPLLQNLSEKQIKNEVENQLLQAGFVIQEVEYPKINIEIKSIYSGSSLSYFAVEISFVEKFLLARNKSITKVEILWSKSEKIFPSNIEKNTIKDTVKKLIDNFIQLCIEIKKEEGKIFVPKAKDTKTKTQENSPFIATYVGGNRPPEVEISNDSDRTLYLDLGQDKIIGYTILSGTRKIIQLDGGEYNFKATAPKVIPLEGKHKFQKGYRYIWRFTIIKQ
ncbi:MAG: hypothetical protein ACR2MD_18880 [Aridibacter sp.]